MRKNGSKKIEVLVFIRHYLPGYKFGGPLRTLSNMADALAEKNVHFKIVTSDRDFWDKKPYSGVMINKWNSIGKAEVFYCSRKQQSFCSFKKLIKETNYDILYLQSFFDPVFTLKVLLLRLFGLISEKPVLLAPRGELSAGALDIKNLKKRVFLNLSKILYKNVFFHASSVLEAEEIGKLFKKESIKVACNLPEIPDIKVKNLWKKKKQGFLRIVFLSRIAPTKNLDYAFEVISMVKYPVIFHIYGPVTDKNYWNICKEKIDNLPAFVSVEYSGTLNHEKVRETLAEYDLFFLPTKNENFGHAIFEALSSGLPVLISDNTMWKKLEESNAGWAVSLEDKRRFTSIIEKCFNMTDEEFHRMRQSAFEYAKDFVLNSGLIDKNLRIFTEILNL